MTDTLDIVKLIEKNPITRLSKDYQSSLITKVKAKFNDPEQQLFVASFYCYLNHNSNKDFIIVFDDIWKWVGFSRKDHAKRIIDKYFILDLDYKVLLPPSGEQNLKKNNRGGSNKETILLTINAFKKFCLKADTKKADDIHNYYIKLEEILHETMNEETLELKNQLLIKDKNIKEREIQHNIDLKLNKHKTLIEKTKGKRCVYISEIEENKFIKIGMTKEISTRHIQLNKKYGKSIFLEVFDCDNYKEVEANILGDTLIKKNLYKQPVNGYYSFEIILLSEEFNYDQLLSIVKNYLSQTYFFTPDQLLEKQKLDLEKQKLDYNIISNILNNELYIDTIKEILHTNLPNLITNLQDKNLISNSISNNITSIEKDNNVTIQNNNNINESMQKHIDMKNKKIQKLENNNINIMNENYMVGNRKTNGKKIQKIDPNNLKNIIKIYDSMIYLLRSPENKGFQKSSIQCAIKSNKIYKDFRWNYVEKDEDPNISKILPTVECKTKKHIIDTILKLNSTKTEILESYSTKAILAKELKNNIRTTRKIIENNELYNNNYYIEYSKCSNELLLNYNKPINKTIPSYTKQIKQINPKTKEFIIFNSLTEISTKYGISNPYILKAIKDKKVFRGFLWDFN